MSWSVNFLGTPNKVSEALTAQSEKLSGQSKQEFDDALPHMKALIESNVGDNKYVKLVANGHATFTDGVKTEGYTVVNIEAAYGLVV